MIHQEAKSDDLLGTFIGKDKLTAHGVAAEFISSLKCKGYYLAWDGEGVS